MAVNLTFNDEEMAIDEGLGYPKAYAKLCRDRSFGPYSHGPPFTFTPYTLSQQEALRAKELDEVLFPIIDPKAKPTAKPRIFASLLWKQLNHLGNAGFDPATFRVDIYGNVLYYHADSASPLAWDIDHWFPCSRGGMTVPSNLKILQWQVCKKMHNKLEFLIPWWDLQLGVSINQFLSIFASANSDFRHRAFSLLFSDGESEELNDSQTVDSHNFPQHFREEKERVGLAPAAIVLYRRESYDASTLKSLDINRRLISNSSIIAARKLKAGISKENENPDMVSNPYQAIVMARDSLRQRQETATMPAEIHKLDDEVNDLKQKTDEEKVNIQDLELVLIKRKRRAEKCRRLAEAQSSYRATLEKMIRDAMHQSVIYKEQLRLNQAAANALMARLEAQKAICDSSERELHKKFKQRDELEKQIRPEWEQARKRSRMDDCLFEEKDAKSVFYLPGSMPTMHLKKATDDVLLEKRDRNTVLYLPGTESKTPLRKELRVFLEEEQKASQAGLSLNEDHEQEEMREGGKGRTLNNNISKGKREEYGKPLEAAEDENPIEDNFQKLKIVEGGNIYKIRFPDIHEPEIEEDEESRKQRGKGNVEKWLQMLLEDTEEGTDQNPQIVDEHESSRTDEIIRKMNLKYPQKEIKFLKFPESEDGKGVMTQFHDQQTIQEKNNGALLNNQQMTPEKNGANRKEEIVDTESRKAALKDSPYRLLSEKNNAHEVASIGKRMGSSNSFEGKDRKEKSGKEKGLARSESARVFRRIPSSPSIILGMRKGVDCIGKKPLVIGDDDDDNEDRAVGINFIKSSIKTIKKAVNI